MVSFNANSYKDTHGFNIKEPLSLKYIFNFSDLKLEMSEERTVNKDGGGGRGGGVAPPEENNSVPVNALVAPPVVAPPAVVPPAVACPAVAPPAVAPPVALAVAPPVAPAPRARQPLKLRDGATMVVKDVSSPPNGELMVQVYSYSSSF